MHTRNLSPSDDVLLGIDDFTRFPSHRALSSKSVRSLLNRQGIAVIENGLFKNAFFNPANHFEQLQNLKIVFENRWISSTKDLKSWS